MALLLEALTLLRAHLEPDLKYLAWPAKDCGGSSLRDSHVDTRDLRVRIRLVAGC
jgi:hypothetical protein